MAEVEAVAADGTREIREISLGMNDRVSAEVLSGLTEGDRVIAGIAEPPRRSFQPKAR